MRPEDKAHFTIMKISHFKINIQQCEKSNFSTIASHYLASRHSQSAIGGSTLGTAFI